MRLGIDIGGTKINIALVDANNRMVANRKIKVREIKNLSQDLKKVIDELILGNSIDYSDIIACGIGIPGTVSKDGKKMLKAPNLSILSEDFVEEIQKVLKMPIRLVQDSRAAAWGEYVCGAGKGSDSVVCITLGTGIGTGIVIDGKIFHGSLGNAGEMGHIPVVSEGRKCGCGKTGCLEKYVAGGGLDISAKILLGEGKTAIDLFNAAKAGNEIAATEIQKAVILLGNAVVSVINLLSPNCVLFSGGLIEQESLFLNPLITYAKEHCYSSGILPKIEKGALGENAPVIGAALIV